MQTILVLGASSTIAQETVRQLAKKKVNFILTARKTKDLESFQQDIQIRYNVNVSLKPFDALHFDNHEAFFSNVIKETGGINGIIVMYGAMGDQQEAERKFNISRNMIDVNYTSVVSILNIAATYFEEKKSGFICAVSSVAGDRGRQSNYIYGSSKAGLTVYMQGLRNRLHRSGINVVTIKPGMVDTKMTYGIVEDSILLSDPKVVATDIVKSLMKRKNVVYTPWFWLIIMLIIKLVPEKVFKRTNI